MMIVMMMPVMIVGDDDSDNCEDYVDDNDD